MKVFKTIKEIQAYLKPLCKNNSIGFVPTMGALHQGHLSLIQRAVEENDVVAASIFVNPTQFNNSEDLEKYPRTLDTDLKMLQKAGCHVVFAPDSNEMYNNYQATTIDFGNLDKVMEGKFRPGHFKGVAQVVERLFRIVEPHKAYLGLKDFQQIAIIKTMIQQTQLSVEIIPCDIIREKSGLAMSSRNRLLNKEQLAASSLIYKTLQQTKRKTKSLSVNDFKKEVVNSINKNRHLDVEYFEVVDFDTLQPIKNWSDSNMPIGCIAAFCGKVRLIDNLTLNIENVN